MPVVTGEIAPPSAREVRRLQRTMARRRVTTAVRVDRAFTVYSIFFGVLIVGSLAWSAFGRLLPDAIAPSLSSRTIAAAGVPALLLLTLAVLWYSTWLGPVVFSEPDVVWLLGAPVDRADSVRPRLVRGLVLGALGGALVGCALLPALAAAPDSPPTVGRLLVPPAIALVGVGAAALGFVVECRRRTAAAVRRAAPVVVIAAAGLGLGAAHGGDAREIVLWSGPWGWALVPATSASSAAWVAALAVLAGPVAVLVRYALGHADAIPLEELLWRAQTRSAFGAATALGDYRGMTLAASATRAPGRAGRRWLAPPGRSALAVPWRDGRALLRTPVRTVTAALAAAACVLAAIRGAQYVLVAGVVALAGLWAASLLLEPLRLEVDDPDRGAVLLPWRHGPLLLRHCLVPACVLGAAVTAAGAIAAAANPLGPTVIVGAALVGAGMVAALVLAAAANAARGGRVSLDALSTAALDPSGISVVSWLLRYELLALAVVGGPVLIMGTAAAHGRSLVPWVIITALGTGGTAAGLAWWIRRVHPDV